MAAWIVPHPDLNGTSNADAARRVPPAATHRGDGWSSLGGDAACGTVRSRAGSGRLSAMDGAAPDDIAARQAAAGRWARRREARHQRQQHDRAIHGPAVRTCRMRRSAPTTTRWPCSPALAERGIALILSDLPADRLADACRCRSRARWSCCSTSPRRTTRCASRTVAPT